MGREVAFLAGVLDLNASPPALVESRIERREIPHAWGSTFVGSKLVFEVFESAAETFEQAREEILRALFSSSFAECHVLDAFRDTLCDRDRALAISLGMRQRRTNRHTIRCKRCGVTTTERGTPSIDGFRCHCGARGNDLEIASVIGIQCDKPAEYITIPIKVKP